MVKHSTINFRIVAGLLLSMVLLALLGFSIYKFTQVGEAPAAAAGRFSRPDGTGQQAAASKLLLPAVQQTFCTNDSDGANDVPGQVDMTKMCLGPGTANPLDMDYSWNWDEIYGSGSNTLDGCTLFDNDQDGNANYALCVRLMPNANLNYLLEYYETILYQCGDARGDRCTQQLVVLTPSAGTVCTASQQNSDPFDGSVPNGPGIVYPQDTAAACLLMSGDVGGASSVLINACTFPSGQPNSNPFDCLVAEGSGFLSLVKVANPNSAQTAFNFTISSGTGGTTPQTIYGSGVSQRLPFPPGTYSVSESVPAGWSLASSACVDQFGNPVGTGSNPISGIALGTGDDVVCVFTDNQATATAASTSTSTPTSTATNTPTSTSTNTPTSTATNTPTSTPTRTATSTPTITHTPEPTERPLPGGLGTVEVFSTALIVAVGLFVLAGAGVLVWLFKR